MNQKPLLLFGHVLQKNGDCLDKETLPGSRAKERPNMTWTDNRTSWTEVSFDQLLTKIIGRSRLNY